jgi:CBS-domain-containing membrane protein
MFQDRSKRGLIETIKSKFKKLWKYYILQGLLAGFVLFVIVLILGEDRMLTISAIGSTAFIVFAMPSAASAQTRNVIGGHLAGLACGMIFLYIGLPYFIEFPLAVMLVFILMVALDVEHPPAAGTALAVLANEVTFNAFITIMLAAVLLSQCRYFVKKYLKDLM